MAQWVKLLLGMFIFNIRVPVRVVTLLLPFQLSGNAPGKAVNNGPTIWVPVAHVRDPDGALAFWLFTGSGLDVVGICSCVCLFFVVVVTLLSR